MTVEKSVASLFGLKIPVSVKVTCWEDNHQFVEFVPQKEQNYLFRTDLLRDVLAWWQVGANEGLYLTGPTGAGKSSLIREVAARLNVPVYQATGHARMELTDLIGHYVVNDHGGMKYEYGPLSRALRDGGIFLLDEIDAVDPSVLIGLNSVLDGTPLHIPEKGGEVIPRNALFRFAATGNTNGSGDESGAYAGTMRLNLAFLDRFWVLSVGYPEAEVELKLLENLGVSKEIGEKFIQVANLIRQQFLSDSFESRLECTMSTRVLMRWVKLAHFFRGRESVVQYALDRALLMRCSERDRTAILEMVQRVFE